MNFVRKPGSQSGQVALVVLLLMVARLVTGLSLASRSAQDLMLSTSQLESSRVFSAAEAGIEEALSSDLNFTGSEQIVNLGSDYYEGAEVEYSINKHSLLDVLVFEGVVIKVDLTGSTAGSLLDIDWSAESNCLTQDPASLLVSIYSQDAGSTQVRHFPLAGCDRSDEFNTTAVSASPEVGLSFHYQLSLKDGDLFARIRPVYNDTRLRVEGANFSLPTQYLSIHSRAKNNYGDELRAVTVNRSLPTQPSIFDFVLFSGDSLIK
ncbi:MAG: hypothetical protein ABFQ62_01820 [Patescibacteria group bacterium]